MIKKLFEVKFLHLLPESSGQIGTAIFPKSPVEPEVCPLKPSDNNFKTAFNNTTLKILKPSDIQSLTYTIVRQGVLYSTSQTT